MAVVVKESLGSYNSYVKLLNGGTASVSDHESIFPQANYSGSGV